LVLEKNANFFAENGQKSQKIVIITSTPCLLTRPKNPKTSLTDCKVKTYLAVSAANEKKAINVFPKIETVSARRCQVVYFQTKNPILGKFCRLLQWKTLVYFMDIWSILRTFGIFNGHLVNFVAI
jgi:hypothetical protein